MSEMLTGAQALIRSLEHVGVEVIFGLPGGAILPVYDPLIESPIRHILVRHEQGAGHMASGYYWATGKPGVCMVTSGPGATNLVTPLCDAHVDSVPIIAVTGQVSTHVIGTDAFQECDTTGITMPITKHNFLITSADDIPQTVAEAFHIATTGRPGPVLIDVPKDVSTGEMRWHWPGRVDLPGYKPTTKGHPKQVAAAARLIMESERPVIYAGGGILKSRAAEELRELAELTQIHVITTLMARGSFPDDHPLCLGMPGMHGSYAAVTAMQRADLLIALGSRFDDRVTGKVAAFAPDAKIIHVDIDPAELGKVRRPDVPIVGEAKSVIADLVKVLRAKLDESPRLERTAWNEQIAKWRRDYPYRYDKSDPDKLMPQYVIECINQASPDAIVAAGVGQHQMWTSQYWRFIRPYTYINSGGLGTMGYAVPAAIGAKVGRPDMTVWAIDGDGCFQMTAQELITAAVDRINVKVAIINNAYLGMVRQWQELFYDERYSEVAFGNDIPDYVKWAEAMGCVGFRVDHPNDVVPTVEKANQINDRPVVIDFRVDPKEKVYPMVPAGASNDDIILDPAHDWTEGDHLIAGLESEEVS